MAPSATSHAQDEPLLPPKLVNEQQPEPLSPTSSAAMKVLSVIRIGTGVACLFVPLWTCALFKFPISADMTAMPRLIGARDLVLGELLITAEDKNSPDGGRGEIRRALYAGMAADAMDIGSICFGVATGTFPRVAGVLFVGAAAGAIGLGALGLRGL